VYDSNSWRYSLDHRQPCKVVDVEEVWGRRFARVWLPQQEIVVRVSVDRLAPLNGAQRSSDRDHLIYLATAAKLADCLNHNTLLAPAASRVIPLPHQIRALQTAVAGERVRFLLADEVGLGKTIEAGLIIRELKMRGLVRRVLVVAPKGLCQQWVSEMDVHFSETFRLLMPDDLKSLRRLGIGGGDRYGESANPWSAFDQVICPLDSVKPMDKRKGWSPQKVAEYNQERFDDLVCAGWDLVAVDESHRLGGATDQVARYKLGRGLGEASPYLLLLSATPHQGKSDGFRRLISLLDPESFMDEASISRESVKPYVIRTEKRFAVTSEGLPLFQPRQTRMVAVEWAERHAAQKTLYEAVSEYVRLGYNQAMREKKTHIGFLLVLMQRLVTSSTRAIRVSLERRLEALREPCIR
jgi:SNF2 family DNA or RNA helicase